MTCKKFKIISESDGTFSLLYNYALLPLVVVYLCIPVVSLIKYIFTDYWKNSNNCDSRTDLRDSNHNSEEFINLKIENALLKDQIQRKKLTADMLNILKSYDYTLQKFVDEHKTVLAERELLKSMLTTLEENYRALSSKYEKARDVIDGLEKNEQTLKMSLVKWEETVREIELRYESFKEYAIGKIDVANNQIKTTDEGYKQQIVRLKSRIAESQVRIKQLETQVSIKGSKGKLPAYMLRPLVSNIK